MTIKINHVGEINTNTHGTKMKIVRYGSNEDIDIEFLDEFHYIKEHQAYSNFKSGGVKNPYDRDLYNVGYFGVGNYSSRDNGKMAFAYKTWTGMIERCYSNKYVEKRRTYLDCYVCEEWHNYQNFKKWFDKNIIELKDKNERVCLDKDILVKGNKVYSPETCCFVPNEINVLFTKTNKNRGLYPIGVYYKKKLRKYVSQCSEKIGKEKKTQIYLGAFATPEEAFQAYKKHKEQYIKKVADKYKGQIKDNVYEALYKWEVEIDD